MTSTPTKDMEVQMEFDEKPAEADLAAIAEAGPRVKSKLEKRLLMKQDALIVTLLGGCFFFAYMDRSQIGNARIMGMQVDLGLTDSQYFNCLMMFYVGYMVFELPFSLLLRLVRPPVVFGSGVILFGIFACCIGSSHAYWAVLILRLFIGIAEAVVQTGNMYLSLWYQRDEIATRAAFFFCPAALAGGVSGLIAYGIDKNLNGAHGLESWRWLFLVGGIPTVGWGLIVMLLLPKLPEETVAKKSHWYFRSNEERNLILERTIAAKNALHAKPALWQIWWALKDPKVWCSSFMVGAASINVAAFGAFLPTFIKEFGFDRLSTQLYTVIPYALAVITIPTVAIISDRINKKALPLLCCFATSLTGFILLLASENRVVSLVGCCLISAASYPAVIVSVAWIMISHAGFTKRATAWAMGQVFIQSYSIIATQIYTTPPRYFKGHGTLLGFNFLGLCGLLLKFWIMKRANKKKEERAAEFAAAGQVDPDNEKDLEELCDYHPSFKYIL